MTTMAEEVVYAKTYREKNRYVGETLEEHTDRLLKNLTLLKENYGKEIEILSGREDFWELLRLACLFHDLGKVSTHFQNKIRSTIGTKTLKVPEGVNREIPHNFLSAAFLPEKINNNDFLLLFYSIVFHHYRKIDFSEKDLKNTIDKDLVKRKSCLEWIKKLNGNLADPLWSGYYPYLKEYSCEYQKIKRDRIYIILKGLLHRLDHSASARLEVETERIKSPEERLNIYLKKKSEKKGIPFKGLKGFQLKAKEIRANSVMLIASTGLGKTEFAINWIGQDKAFYTLPLRVSVNAMYERFSEIFTPEKVGLLHGDSLLYALDAMKESSIVFDNDSLEEHIHMINMARQFSMPITITTADQLFTAVFKWKGYEKIYATLMYSKVVLDEPQSYSPEMLAMIIKALQEVSDYGGRFCFMSATIHPFIRSYLEQYLPDNAVIERFLDVPKHKISLQNRPINELIDSIKEAYTEGRKVLVIVNTIKKAQNLYELLKENTKVKLLHSGFIQRHRRIKENEIKNDYTNNEPVIWITTQIVEASLDIDYDILFTEVATLDALIQRMGRVYRRIDRKISDVERPNVVIALDEPSDRGYIYNSEIVKLTKNALNDHEGKILTEYVKQKMMNLVFDKKAVKNTNFYKSFEKFYNLLADGFETDSRGEAQWLFRHIASLTVIPLGVYNDNIDEIESALEIVKTKGVSLSDRMKALNIINDYSLTIPYYKVKDSVVSPIMSQRNYRDVYILNIDYNYELGLVFESERKKADIFL